MSSECRDFAQVMDGRSWSSLCHRVSLFECQLSPGKNVDPPIGSEFAGSNGSLNRAGIRLARMVKVSDELIAFHVKLPA